MQRYANILYIVHGFSEIVNVRVKNNKNVTFCNLYKTNSVLFCWDLSLLGV